MSLGNFKCNPKAIGCMQTQFQLLNIISKILVKKKTNNFVPVDFFMFVCFSSILPDSLRSDCSIFFFVILNSCQMVFSIELYTQRIVGPIA